MNESFETAKIPVAVVGLGLMGSSITTCLLIAGHPVIGIAPIESDLQHAAGRILENLELSLKEGLIEDDPKSFMQRLIISANYDLLKKCRIIIECTLENIDVKKSVFEKIEAVISPDAILTSNTSAIPISDLQRLTQHPERFYGLHWMIPAFTTRFLEIICGEKSDIANAEWLYKLAHQWAKEPTLMKKDIRGFLNNRLMYAMYREAFYLVENGYATVDDIDRAVRNGPGYWITLMGIFRWMDLTGIPAYHAVMKDLFPTLSNTTEVPALIDDIVKEGGTGVINGNGFYSYTPEEAKCWADTYAEFSFDLRKLALKYPIDIVDKKLSKLA
jgi:3-hydroxybutyryl-CoA dehydrogenase